MAPRNPFGTFLGRHAVAIAGACLLLAWADVGLRRFAAIHLPDLPFAVLSVVLLLAAGIRNSTSQQRASRKLPQPGRIIAVLGLLSWIAWGYAWWTQKGLGVGVSDAAWYLLLISTTLLDFTGMKQATKASHKEDAFPITD